MQSISFKMKTVYHTVIVGIDAGIFAIVIYICLKLCVLDKKNVHFVKVRLFYIKIKYI